MTEPASELSVSPFVATIPCGTRYLTIPEASKRLAEAIHPTIEGELPLAEALKHQSNDGVHFSEAAETTIQNAVLRRTSTEVYHEAGLQTAVREGRITSLSPMTYGPKAISMQDNPRWQSEVNRCLIHISDIATYAKDFNIKVVSAEWGGNTGTSQTHALSVVGTASQCLPHSWQWRCMMETTHTTAVDIQTASQTLPPKAPKRRIKKLTAAEVVGLPGVTHAPEPMVQTDLKYFLCFLLPVSVPIGTSTEATQVLDFAYQLNTVSVDRGVGAVTAVGLFNGQAEVVMKLNVPEVPNSNAVPVNNAFARLNDHLDDAPALRSGPAGKPAVWKAKVNGTTIVEGHY